MSVGHTAGTHRIIRSGQADNLDEYHHPVEKMAQLSHYQEYIHGDILEVFAGQGNLTDFYSAFGNVTAMTRDTTGNSFDAIYELRARRTKFDLIDIDSYGYPDLFFPVVFELMRDCCLLVFTFPIVGVNALNGITEQHFVTFWRSSRPTTGDVVGTITDMALRNWYLPSLLDVCKIQRIWRFVFLCKRVKATVMCNVRNH